MRRVLKINKQTKTFFINIFKLDSFNYCILISFFQATHKIDKEGQNRNIRGAEQINQR